MLREFENPGFVLILLLIVLVVAGALLLLTLIPAMVRAGADGVVATLP